MEYGATSVTNLLDGLSVNHLALLSAGLSCPEGRSEISAQRFFEQFYHENMKYQIVIHTSHQRRCLTQEGSPNHFSTKASI
jgi:hypothetical protein